METAIVGISSFLLFVSLVCLVLGLIRPKIFSRFFKGSVNRKKISIIFGSASVVFIILISIFHAGTPILTKMKSPTNQKSLTVSGNTSYENSAIKLYLNSEIIKEMNADDKGNFSVPIELKEGTNKIKASATSDKNKTKTSSEAEVVYDITPPDFSLDQPQTPTSSDKFTLKGKSEKNAQIIIYSVDKELKKTKIRKDSFEIKDITLIEGENKFVVKAIDEADNYSQPKEITIVYNKPKEEPKKTEAPKQTTTPKPVATTPVPVNTPSPQAKPPQSQSDPQIIESLVQSDFETTVLDSGGNFANDKSSSPFEVIVNTSNGQVSSCSSAKIVMYDIMHKIYTDTRIKSKISRVKVTIWGQLKASLGSADVFYNGNELSWSGETNFWRVMMQVKPYEDESGSLNTRTWGEGIGSCR